MPQAIPAIAAAIAEAAAAVGTAVFDAGVAIGLPAELVTTLATVASAATSLALTIGPSLLVSAALAPHIPPPAAVQTPLKEPVPVRRSGYGRARLSGYYMLYEAKGKFTYDVLACHQGRIDTWETYYLDDDVVEVDGFNGVLSPDGKKWAYGAGGGADARVKLYSRVGLATETAYSAIVSALPTIWTSAHRGDGTASLALICQQSKPKFQQEDFPTGVPRLSAVGRLARVYDPRLNGTESQGDPANWTWTENPVLQLMDYMTNADLGTPGSDRGGMGLSFDRHFRPTIDEWIEAANICEELVDLAAGGTEQRYRCGGVYDHTATPAEVIGTILSTCDGWIGTRGDGAFVIRVGKYSAPTVTLNDDHVTGYNYKHFTTDEEAVNELTPTFTDPEQNFNVGDVGAWRDEADIVARGKLRSQAMPLLWAPSRTQARRLAKRAMNRNSAELRGTIKTNLYGINALGERYLNLRIAENVTLRDIVVEVSKVEIDLTNIGLTIDWVQVDPDTIDDWDPETEEGEVATPPARSAATLLGAPTGTIVSALIAKLNGTESGARLSIASTAPFDDVEWIARVRQQGETDWTETSFSDAGDGTGAMVSGVVPGSGTLEVQTAYRTAGGISDWSDTETIAVAVAGSGTASIVASETLAAGDKVNLHTVAGAARMRKANATDLSKPAHGFVDADVSSGAAGDFIGPGHVNTAYSGLTDGATYWLATTGGDITTTPPSGPGNGVQEVGQATADGALMFAPKQMIGVRA